MEEHHSLFQRYRLDRRKLLKFLLSSSSDLSRIDYDTLSADYVIHCVKSGEVVDIAEATKKYFQESSYPPMVLSKLGDSFYLHSDPDDSGSLPRCAPPPVNVQRVARDASSSSRQLDSLKGNIEKAGYDNGFKK